MPPGEAGSGQQFEQPDAQLGAFFCPESTLKMLTDLPAEEYESSRRRAARVLTIMGVGT